MRLNKKAGYMCLPYIEPYISRYTISSRPLTTRYTGNDTQGSTKTAFTTISVPNMIDDKIESTIPLLSSFGEIPSIRMAGSSNETKQPIRYSSPGLHAR